MDDVTFVHYPVFRRVAPVSPGAGAEVEELFESLDVEVRGVYVTTGFRPDTDLMLWWTAPSPDALQDALLGLRRTSLGPSLELTHAFTGVVRPAEFNPDHLPAFLRGEAPKRYLSVYPFVRTVDWYLLPPDERSKLLREHGGMGREFPDVLPNTTAGFGLGDWEWILAFEADRMERITDCIRALRASEARRYTKLDVPFVVGIRKDLPEAIADLA